MPRFEVCFFGRAPDCISDCSFAPFAFQNVQSLHFVVQFFWFGFGFCCWCTTLSPNAVAKALTFPLIVSQILIRCLQTGDYSIHVVVPAFGLSKHWKAFIHKCSMHCHYTHLLQLIFSSSPSCMLHAGLPFYIHGTRTHNATHLDSPPLLFLTYSCTLTRGLLAWLIGPPCLPLILLQQIHDSYCCSCFLWISVVQTAHCCSNSSAQVMGL
uniref:Uncharacterized protein n=1 Tax=Eutreptiella gymnastica TaxID=73025 RepID=A0A7S1JES8_9EUGL|mmetsp:Transcript_8918/g.15899  ORF Transcript_8918/g.15899 Transcript_8918/m.15899 type:complete len:211 (+) Transcript_8918:642-1274(+)